VEWDGWAEEPASSRTAWIVGGLMAVAFLAVGGLAWWALTTDAGDLPESAEPEPGDAARTTIPSPEAPSLDALRAVVPEDLQGCVPPADQPEGAATDGTVRLECPRSSVPELVTFTLFPDEAARDQAFADTVTLLELDPGAAGDCALRAGAVHDFGGDRGRGQVACRAAEARVDIAWTDGTSAVLGVAGGFGSYPAHYGYWSDLVGRTDAEFPLPFEEALLDQLPPELTTRCDRDLELVDRAGGVVAVTCEPAVGEAAEVSWIRFADADAMTDWIEAEQARLDGAVTDTTESACRPGGRGPSGELPPPWLGATPYRQGGSTGTILCHADAEGRNVLRWTRAGENIGSVAVSDGSVGDVTMADLAAWWEAGGHLP
jgi:hypothetical protein